MYKKIFYLILLLGTVFFIQQPAFANDWGVFARYTRNYEDFALSYALDGEPIFYYIIIDEDTKNKENSTNKENSIKTELENKLVDELKNEKKPLLLH